MNTGGIQSSGFVIVCKLWLILIDSAPNLAGFSLLSRFSGSRQVAIITANYKPKSSGCCLCLFGRRRCLSALKTSNVSFQTQFIYMNIFVDYLIRHYAISIYLLDMSPGAYTAWYPLLKIWSYEWVCNSKTVSNKQFMNYHIVNERTDTLKKHTETICFPLEGMIRFLIQ